MTKYTPLDTLIDTVLRVSNTIGLVTEYLTGAQGDPVVDEDGPEINMLDRAQRDLWTAIAAHVQNIEPEHPQGSTADFPTAWRYSDGNRVAEAIELSNGTIAIYYPRYDGDRDEFIRAFEANTRPRLHAVPKE